MSQVITITFAPGRRTAIAAEPLEQWAYGQRLQFAGLDLPESYQVDFSNFEFCGSSIPRVGGADGVSVPVEVLASGRNVYAFIWLQDATSGARAYRATVRVIPGPAPDPEESPEEQSAVTEAINALNTAAESIPELVEAAVEEATASGDFSGVFWATYGETTAAEVAQAITQKKLVMTKRTDRYFYLSYVERFGSVPLNYWFVNVRLGVNSAYSTLYLSSTDTWEVGVQNGSIASLASPAFTGTPTAPTAGPGTDSDQLATTAFVQAAIGEIPEPGQTISEELKQALLQIARKVAYIDDQGSVYYQDLYDALYPPKELVSISAVFTQGQTVVYDTASLDSLKSMLVVTGTYDDQSTETIPSTGYTLSGTLTAGTSTITVTCDGKTTTFTVQVTHQPGVYAVTNNLTGCVNSNTAASVTEGGSYSGTITASAGYMMTGATVSITMGGTDITGTAYSNGTISIASVSGALVITVTAVAVTLSSISAVYTQSVTVYPNTSLNSLKNDLVVTATYSDSSTATVAAADYTLSGTLTAGTSTITVTYQSKTTTFTVTVTASIVPSGYTAYDYVAYTGSNKSSASESEMILTKVFDDLTSVKIDFDFMPLKSQTGGTAHLVGGRQGNSSAGNGYLVAIYCRTDTKRVSAFSHGTAIGIDNIPTIAVNSKSHVTLDPGSASPSTLTVDESSQTGAWTTSNTINQSLAICGTMQGGSKTLNYFAGIGILRIYDTSDTKIGEYVPCVRDADSVIGLYDTVTETFYTAATLDYVTVGGASCEYSVGSWEV